MNTKYIISILSALLMLVGITGCEGEKDLVIIDGQLPIKTSTLYMVGDATPNGWSLDAATALNPTEADPLVFTWEGALNTGEMKLCLATGSWDNPFIRPLNAGEEIGKSGLDNVTFKMHAGDPDDKWNVIETGIYNLQFDLRNWTMSATYIRDFKPTPRLFIIGDATAGGWSLDDATELTPVEGAEGAYTWTGTLKLGTFKACTEKDFSAPFYRPSNADVEVSEQGVAANDMVYTTDPDDQWKVTKEGNYELTLNIEAMTISVNFID